MSLKKRSRISEDEFIDGAEKDQSWQQNEDPDQRALANAKKRASSGRKFSIYSIYGTEQQKELLSRAAEEQDITQAKLIQRYLFERLEKEYGHLL